jgi:hypothetical protein
MPGFPGTQGVPTLKWNFPNLVGTVQTILPVGTGQAGPRVLYALYVLNTQTSLAAFVQLFDLASASGVTLGTAVPDLQMEVAGSTAAFFPIPSTVGVAFTNGIQIASTTTVSGSTGSATGVYVYALYL